MSRPAGSLVALHGTTVSGVFNLPAAAIRAAGVAHLVVGIRESAGFNRANSSWVKVAVTSVHFGFGVST